MQLERRQRYPAKVDEVVGLLTDESVLCAKYRELEQPPPERVHRVDDGEVIELRQRRRVRFPVPTEALRLLVPEPVVDSVERWDPPDLDGSRRAHLELRTGSLPVWGVGTLVLTPDDDDGCTCEVLVDLHSDLPVLGGRLVDAVARGAEELIDADHRANLSFLERRRP